MIDFISPESAPTTKKIHASYNTCINEARRRYEAAEQRHREMFRTCVHFSIALDTAQFGQEHFLSCVGRFGFPEKICQEIIIFEKVTATTGKDTARFVYDKLAQRRCDFTKLVSITTDGAKNMVGQNSGMAMELINIINQESNGI